MADDEWAAFYFELGRRVRTAREQKGSSQAALARSLGVTRSSVSNLEAGRQRPPLHVLARIASVTGTDWPGLLPDLELVGASRPQYRDLTDSDLASVMLLRQRAAQQEPA